MSSGIEELLMQLDDDNGLEGWEYGTFLRVVEPRGDTKLTQGELVIVVDPDRYPTLKRQLISKVGYNNFKFFVCVQGVTNDHAGFYAKPRFKLAEGVGLA